MERAVMLRTGLLYAGAAVAEIGGCYAVWAVLRRGSSWGWLMAAAGLLGSFAWLLARTDQQFAGRAYAAYGGVYVVASLVWMWAVEGGAPSRMDVLGAVLVLAGAAVIFNQP